jgi:hypothetical protein
VDILSYFIYTQKCKTQHTKPIFHCNIINDLTKNLVLGNSVICGHDVDRHVNDTALDGIVVIKLSSKDPNCGTSQVPDLFTHQWYHILQ